MKANSVAFYLTSSLNGLTFVDFDESANIHYGSGHPEVKLERTDKFPLRVDSINTVNSSSFRETLSFDDTNSFYSEYKPQPSIKFKRYVIAKNEGLVMYETMDGEVFVKQPAEKHPFIPPKHHWWYGLFFGFRYYLLY